MRLAEQFVNPAHRTTLMVEQVPDVLLDRFASYQPPSVQKWVEKSQTL